MSWIVYCRSGNIREVLIFNESRENYYYNSATEEKMKIREL